MNSALRERRNTLAGERGGQCVLQPVYKTTIPGECYRFRSLNYRVIVPMKAQPGRHQVPSLCRSTGSDAGRRPPDRPGSSARKRPCCAKRRRSHFALSIRSISTARRCNTFKPAHRLLTATCCHGCWDGGRSLLPVSCGRTWCRHHQNFLLAGRSTPLFAAVIALPLHLPAPFSFSYYIPLLGRLNGIALSFISAFCL